MENKKKVPAIRFEGFDEEWEEKKLGEIMNVTSVKRILQSDWTDKGIRFLRARDIVSAFKNEEVNDLLFISKEKYDEYSLVSGKVQKGDLLVTGVGTIGIPMIILDNEPVYFKDGNIIWFQNKCKIPFYFFYYSFIGKRIQEFIANSAGIGTVGTYTIESGKKTPIQLPSTNEQTKIGNYFKELDSLIRLQEQKLEKVTNLKKAMLEKMFPKENTDVPEIRFERFTEKWEKKKLGEIATIVGGGTPSTSNKEFWDGTIDWYSPTEIGDKVYVNESEKKITQLGLEKSSATILPAGRTVLFTSRAGIGDMAILARPGATNQGFQSLVLKDNYDVYFVYAVGFLIKRFAQKYSSGSTFLEISGKALSRMLIKIPSFQEQQKIGKYFQNLDQLISQSQQKIEQLKHLKLSLLQKMFI